MGRRWAPSPTSACSAAVRRMARTLPVLVLATRSSLKALAPPLVVPTFTLFPILSTASSSCRKSRLDLNSLHASSKVLKDFFEHGLPEPYKVYQNRDSTISSFNPELSSEHIHQWRRRRAKTKQRTWGEKRKGTLTRTSST